MTFGDMIKVPGSQEALSTAKGDGAKVEMMFSPVEVVDRAEADPHTTYVIAAVGFETTIPHLCGGYGRSIEPQYSKYKIFNCLKNDIASDSMDLRKRIRH